MKVRDLMVRVVISVQSDESIATAHDLMIEHDIRHLPVVGAEQELVGMISHRDLLRRSLVEQNDVPSFVEEHVRQGVRADEVMTSGVLSVEPDTDIREAAQTMIDAKIGSLPVVEGEHLVGILTESDFVRLMAQGD